MRLRRALAAAGAAAALCATAACGTDDEAAGRTEIKMWSHSAGNPTEIEVIEKIVREFNASQDRYSVKAEFFPQRAYNDAIVAAATAGDLPCLIDMDGPVMPNWAWAEAIVPLDLPKETTDKFLPSAIGRWDGKIYSIGYWDAALSIFARKSALEDAGVRIPTREEPWTRDEFDDVLTKVKEGGDYEYPIDLGVWDAGEWWAYAYSPMLQSFGGDLIDRETYKQADGTLNGREAVAFGEWFQSLFEQGYASRTPSLANADFFSGKVAMSWTGNWNAPTALETFKDDLIFLPPPDLGNGPKIGGASWQWGISANCEDTKGANDYIEFSLQDKYIADFGNATGNIPATEGGAAGVEAYQPGGPLEEMVDFSREYAVIRPPTPAYAVITNVFERTLKDIVNGADVKSSLDRAVDQIDFNIDANDGYGF
jgi:multiple sugar transport system substrate-binding protein